jgi:glycosyltransferase involved in cell wall biosynthesis
MEGRDIICLSSHYWHEAWFRKQHFMSRLASDNRVLYVEPSYPMLRKRPHDIAENRLFTATLINETPTIWRLLPPRKIPKWTIPWMTKINFLWFGWWISKAARKLGFRNSILWVYVHHYASALTVIPHSKLVFELVDDYIAYNEGKPTRQSYDEACIISMFKHADVAIATAETLRIKYQQLHPSISVLPNGVDYSSFEQALREKKIPEGMVNIPHPIVGFVGVLFSFLDYPRLRRTIQKMPDVSFVFVGRVEYEKGIRELCDLPNVYILGNRPQSLIPAYISSFDVCINPFKFDEVSRHVSPLKVFEYLACGKPVLSTPMEALSVSLGKDADVIYWDDLADQDYSNVLRKALEEKNELLSERRRKTAARFSWDNLYSNLLDFVEPEL